jgi:hypothetical protein
MLSIQVKKLVGRFERGKRLKEELTRGKTTLTDIMLVHAAPPDLGQVALDFHGNARFLWWLKTPVRVTHPARRSKSTPALKMPRAVVRPPHESAVGSAW